MRQLILDPAIQQEFLKLRRELEEHKSTIQQLKEQNDSLTFTAESKVGRQLIKKTKMLADENQEMAQQLREGPGAVQVRFILFPLFLFSIHITYYAEAIQVELADESMFILFVEGWRLFVGG